MTGNEILQSDLLDILFQNRNKEYGAYTLRRTYNQHMFIAICSSLSIVFVLIIINSFSVNNESVISTDVTRDSVKLVEYIPDREKPKKYESSKGKQIKNVNIKIVANTEVTKTEVPDQVQLNEGIISEKNAPEGYPNGLEKETGNEDFPGISTQVTNEVIPIKEIPPSYPGGPQAFSDFLSRNLSAPEELEPGDKKTVLVGFWVDADGFISRIEIIQSGGKSFDKEVIRVLRKMPKWNPAEQNGHKVPTAFSQPVTFVGIEQ